MIARIGFPSLLFISGIYIVFFSPARVCTRTSISDHLVFHEPVAAYLQTEAYFLPDPSVVVNRDDIHYSYTYKEEGWAMDQFCIHLTMTNVDTGMANGYKDHMMRSGAERICLNEGQEVWMTGETEESMRERSFLLWTEDGCGHSQEWELCFPAA